MWKPVEKSKKSRKNNIPRYFAENPQNIGEIFFVHAGKTRTSLFSAVKLSFKHKIPPVPVGTDDFVSTLKFLTMERLTVAAFLISRG